MTGPRSAWRWATAFLALGAFLLVVVAATDEHDGDATSVAVDPYPGAPHPVVTVDPVSDLVDHQVVTVHGEGFDPGGGVSLVQGAGYSAADVTEVDDDGSFTRDLAVVAVVTNGDEEIDCRSRTSECTLSVRTFPPGGGTDTERATVPLAFAPDAPLVPPSTLMVSPLTGLADGDLITISGEHFRPGDAVTTAICVDDTTFPGERCTDPGGFGGYDADGDGRIRQPYRATPVLTTMAGDRIDCRRDACVLIVGDDGLVDSAAYPLEFDPDGGRGARPEAFVRVIHGTELQVQGDGFVPTEEVYLMPCIHLDDGPHCQVPTPTHTTADGDGTINVTFDPGRFAGFESIQDCRAHRCFVKVYGTAAPGGTPEVRAPFALDP